MIITKKRIRNVELYWHLIEDETEFYIGVSEINRFAKTLTRIGFSQNLELGETILPRVIGPVSRFNAEGRNDKQKHLEKETAYRQVMWKWKQFIGGGQFEEIEEVRDVPYQRYQVEFIAPPSEELSIVEVDGQKMILSSRILKTEENSIKAKHLFNLFFELFGECMMLTEDLDAIQLPEVIRKNWSVLPPGEYPFEEIEEHINQSLSVVRNRNSRVIKYRIQEVNNFTPNFIAVGTSGFTGYWIFGFPNKNIFILESVYPNNATYILGNNWELVSQLSKAEILRQDMQIARIVHRNTWLAEITNLLN
ncbi:hypothetical protein J2X31_000115 [Flavobacterium arsenatis]|uniref:DUF4132 domain-containing protein n=1 Tax=Flavobacterium arsenatis TaxID=1484332 RepID=A0ABU1TJF3_9FLAO|nr:hypothetical protein [Flavobacterium arsenatis]MDR6966122.1 hypothetical protein [Flavobacterium arsenatis]